MFKILLFQIVHLIFRELKIFPIPAKDISFNPYQLGINFENY